METSTGGVALKNTKVNSDGLFNPQFKTPKIFSQYHDNITHKENRIFSYL